RDRGWQSVRRPLDHRVIDGALGGRFLNAIQQQVEALTADDLNLNGF
ncbi:hypothetical protein IIB34_07005, partial [PVC group bacterium]|nr:hypothetical protein [PVC group bacterium]